jgi:hypothetical protein
MSGLRYAVRVRTNCVAALAMATAVAISTSPATAKVVKKAMVERKPMASLARTLIMAWFRALVVE